VAVFGKQPAANGVPCELAVHDGELRACVGCAGGVPLEQPPVCEMPEMTEMRDGCNGFTRTGCPCPCSCPCPCIHCCASTCPCTGIVVPQDTSRTQDAHTEQDCPQVYQDPHSESTPLVPLSKLRRFSVPECALFAGVYHATVRVAAEPGRATVY
jgi:hypothetical protein